MLKPKTESKTLILIPPRHGLKPKKALIGPKKELWDLLQCVEKRHPEAVDITASVRDLPTVKYVYISGTN